MLAITTIMSTFHIVHGGIENGDKKFLERAARSKLKVSGWVVPKGVKPGDEVVIYVGPLGFFATARVTSHSKPRPDQLNRYGASLDSVQLIEPPISLGSIQHNVPKLKWTNFPRSITTLSEPIAAQIRTLIDRRKKTGLPDLDEAALALANIEELRKVALLRSRKSVTQQARKVIFRARSEAIKRYVLLRANGHCEGCKAAAPFKTAIGLPYLEPHHIDRLADDGPDHPAKVAGLCPNCHRRAHYSFDAKTFNRSLRRKTASLERRSV